MTVPRTTDGLATAISQLSSALRTTDSRRSGEPARRHPPAIAFGDETAIPDAVADHVPDTGLRVRVPDRVDALIQVAPLAYYLGADVVVDDGPPTLEAIDGDFEHAFPEPPSFQVAVAAALRRVFLVERLVYYDQDVNDSPSDLAVLDDLAFDPAAYDSLSDVERVRTALDLSFDAASVRLPEWHAATFVDPTFENATALPYLLRYLSVVFDPNDHPAVAAGDSPLSAADAAGAVPERVVQATPHGSSVGWLADDAPPDGTFVARPEAFANATRYIGRDEGAGRILVVCNDASRRASAERVAERYRTHTPPSVNVEAYGETSVATLRKLFERGADFLHFLGDATDGFACSDGRLQPGDLRASNVRLLFADAPESTGTTLACLEHGTVGGFAVPGNAPPSKSVREALTGLFSRGCTVEQAARYANLTAGDASPVRAVGHGFQQLVRSMTLYCPTATVEPAGQNAFDVTVYPYIPRAGFVWRPEPLDVPSKFCASPFELTVTGPEIDALVDTENLIPVYDVHVHWNDHADFFNPLL